MFTSRLTATATRSSGAPRSSAICNVLRKSATTCSVPISLSGKTPHQGTNQQVPSVDDDEQKNLERGGDYDRGQLHHADRRGDGRSHQIDDEKGEEQRRADAKPGLQFAQEIGGRDNTHAEIF